MSNAPRQWRPTRIEDSPPRKRRYHRSTFRFIRRFHYFDLAALPKFKYRKPIRLPFYYANMWRVYHIGFTSQSGANVPAWYPGATPGQIRSIKSNRWYNYVPYAWKKTKPRHGGGHTRRVYRSLVDWNWKPNTQIRYGIDISGKIYPDSSTRRAAYGTEYQLYFGGIPDQPTYNRSNDPVIPSFISDMPRFAQAMMFGVQNPNESIYEPEWARRQREYGYFGWVGSSLAPLYAMSLFRTMYRAGWIPVDTMPQPEAGHGMYTYMSRFNEAMTLANRYDYLRQQAEAYQDKYTSFNITDVISYYGAAENLQLAKAVYWQGQQDWAPTAAAWQIGKLTTFAFPKLFLTRALGFGPYQLAQRVFIANQMAPYVKTAMNYDYEDTLTTIRKGEGPLNFVFGVQNWQDQAINNVLEWTVGQQIMWGLMARRPGAAAFAPNIMGIRGTFIEPFAVEGFTKISYLPTFRSRFDAAQTTTRGPILGGIDLTTEAVIRDISYDLRLGEHILRTPRMPTKPAGFLGIRFPWESGLQIKTWEGFVLRPGRSFAITAKVPGAIEPPSYWNRWRPTTRIGTRSGYYIFDIEGQPGRALRKIPWGISDLPRAYFPDGLIDGMPTFGRAVQHGADVYWFQRLGSRLTKDDFIEMDILMELDGLTLKEYNKIMSGAPKSTWISNKMGIKPKPPIWNPNYPAGADAPWQRTGYEYVWDWIDDSARGLPSVGPKIGQIDEILAMAIDYQQLLLEQEVLPQRLQYRIRRLDTGRFVSRDEFGRLGTLKRVLKSTAALSFLQVGVAFTAEVIGDIYTHTILGMPWTEEEKINTTIKAAMAGAGYGAAYISAEMGFEVNLFNKTLKKTPWGWFKSLEGLGAARGTGIMLTGVLASLAGYEAGQGVGERLSAPFFHAYFSSIYGNTDMANMMAEDYAKQYGPTIFGIAGGIVGGFLPMVVAGPLAVSYMGIKTIQYLTKPTGMTISEAAQMGKLPPSIMNSPLMGRIASFEWIVPKTGTEIINEIANLRTQVIRFITPTRSLGTSDIRGTKQSPFEYRVGATNAIDNYVDMYYGIREMYPSLTDNTYTKYVDTLLLQMNSQTSPGKRWIIATEIWRANKAFYDTLDQLSRDQRIDERVRQSFMQDISKYISPVNTPTILQPGQRGTGILFEEGDLSTPTIRGVRGPFRVKMEPDDIIGPTWQEQTKEALAQHPEWETDAEIIAWRYGYGYWVNGHMIGAYQYEDKINWSGVDFENDRVQLRLPDGTVVSGSPTDFAINRTIENMFYQAYPLGRSLVSVYDIATTSMYSFKLSTKGLTNALLDVKAWNPQTAETVYAAENRARNWLSWISTGYWTDRTITQDKYGVPVEMFPVSETRFFRTKEIGWSFSTLTIKSGVQRFPSEQMSRFWYGKSILDVGYADPGWIMFNAYKEAETAGYKFGSAQWVQIVSEAQSLAHDRYTVWYSESLKKMGFDFPDDLDSIKLGYAQGRITSEDYEKLSFMSLLGPALYDYVKRGGTLSDRQRGVDIIAGIMRSIARYDYQTGTWVWGSTAEEAIESAQSATSTALGPGYPGRNLPDWIIDAVTSLRNAGSLTPQEASTITGGMHVSGGHYTFVSIRGTGAKSTIDADYALAHPEGDNFIVWDFYDSDGNKIYTERRVTPKVISSRMTLESMLYGIPTSAGDTYTINGVTFVWVPGQGWVTKREPADPDSDDWWQYVIQNWFPGCFVPGTKIRMGDGEDRTIEHIKVGDFVLSYDERLGKNVVSKVIKTFKHDICDIVITINNRVTLTLNHPVLVNGEWKEIGAAKLGDMLRDIDGNGIKLITFEVHKTKRRKVYNLEVEGSHTYYAEGILVHNKADIMDPFTGGPISEGAHTTAAGLRQVFTNIPTDYKSLAPRTNIMSSKLSALDFSAIQSKMEYIGWIPPGSDYVMIGWKASGDTGEAANTPRYVPVWRNVPKGVEDTISGLFANSWNILGLGSDIILAGKGFEGRVTRPTIIVAGESGGEDISISPTVVSESGISVYTPLVAVNSVEVGSSLATGGPTPLSMIIDAKSHNPSGMSNIQAEITPYVKKIVRDTIAYLVDNEQLLGAPSTWDWQQTSVITNMIYPALSVRVYDDSSR